VTDTLTNRGRDYLALARTSAWTAEVLLDNGDTFGSLEQIADALQELTVARGLLLATIPLCD